MREADVGVMTRLYGVSKYSGPFELRHLLNSLRGILLRSASRVHSFMIPSLVNIGCLHKAEVDLLSLRAPGACSSLQKWRSVRNTKRSKLSASSTGIARLKPNLIGSASRIFDACVRQPPYCGCATVSTLLMYHLARSRTKYLS